MPQDKPSGSKPNKPGSTPAKTSAAPQPSKVDKYSVKPEFWEQLLDSIPPWGDEIAGIVMLVFGFVSLLSVLDVSSGAPLARAWSDVLTGLFGYGSILIALGFIGLGVLIFLPKVGLKIHFPSHRILALEFAFLAVLGLLHLSSGDSEYRAIARAGQGGGAVGGALASLLGGTLGTTTAVVLFTLVLMISLGIVIGIKRQHVGDVLKGWSASLHAYADRTETHTRRYLGMYSIKTPEGAALKHATSLVRIRPDRANLPPSLREDSYALPPLGIDEPRTENLSEEERALFTRPDHKSSDMSGIGAILKGQRDERGNQLITRPDGRVKRYFSVDRIREVKRPVKRDKGLPPLDLLQDRDIFLPEENEINRNVVLIENTLLEFDIDIDVIDVQVGPTVTQYAVQPFADHDETSSARTRLSKIASYANDLTLALSAKRLRLETPVPGKGYMGIEVPNKTPSIVTLRSVYESKAYAEQLAKAKSPLYVPLGRDVAGVPIGLDIATCPHLLIAGTTGSGKSIAMNAIACALVMDNLPDQVKLVMLDPKMVEMVRFNGLPHLIGPVETELDRCVEVLRWCTREMDRRYKLLEEHSARNISDYNSKLGARRRKDSLPYIVIMIDEVGDLMLSKPEETESSITRLAQMARAVGMHLIIATQRPSTDVITGLIKANFPTRIAFSVASSVDSRVILDSVGAESLLGKGDMLFLAIDAAAARRLQGCFISDEEVRAVVAHWRRWLGDEIAAGRQERLPSAPWERGVTRRELLAETDAMLEEAIALVIAEQEASASLIQRKLGLGYPRAARIMDLLDELGIVGEPIQGGRARKVMIKPGEDPFKDEINRRAGGR
jgi:S-DNA-T family DNA segregation ATPase FtsK/SpoIIIE